MPSTQFNLFTTSPNTLNSPFVAIEGSNAYDINADWPGHNLRESLGVGSFIAFSFTGTALAIYSMAQYNVTGFQIFVDGTDVTPATLQPGNASQILNTFAASGGNAIVSGLTDTTHTCLVLLAGTWGSAAWIEDKGFVVTGASPAVSAHPTYGPYTTIGNSTDLGFTNSNLPHLGLWGNVSHTLGAKWATQVVGPGGVLEFNITGPSCLLEVNAAGTSGLFYSVDGGEWQGPLVITQTGPLSAYQWEPLTLFTGLSNSQHNVRVMSNPVVYANVNIAGIITPGGTFNTATPLPAITSSIAFYGDSITYGGGTANSPNAIIAPETWCNRLARSLGVGATIYGVSGMRVYNTTGTTFVNQTSNITSISPAPSVVFILAGINDYVNTPIQGLTGSALATALSNFTTAYTTMLNNLTTGLPSTQFYCLEPLPYSSGVNNLAPSIQQAIAASTGSSRIQFIPTAAMNLDTTNMLQDGLHPNCRGSEEIAAYLANRLGSLFPGAPTTSAPSRSFGHFGGSTQVTRKFGVFN